MSVILNFQSLTGMVGLVKDAVTQRGFKGLGGNEVHGPAQQFGQTMLEAYKGQ